MTKIAYLSPNAKYRIRYKKKVLSFNKLITNQDWKLAIFHCNCTITNKIISKNFMCVKMIIKLYKIIELRNKYVRRWNKELEIGQNWWHRQIEVEASCHTIVECLLHVIH